MRALQVCAPMWWLMIVNSSKNSLLPNLILRDFHLEKRKYEFSQKFKNSVEFTLAKFHLKNKCLRFFSLILREKNLLFILVGTEYYF